MEFRRLFLFLLLTTGLLCNGFSQKKKQSLLTKKYPPELLKEDALIFRDIVLAMHPSIGIYQPREYYVGILNNLVNSINDSLTQKDFRLRMKLVADELHCGHTEILYSQSFYREVNKMKMNFSPYIFIPVQNKVYLLANLNKKNDSLMKKGAEITRINGITVDSMLRYSRRFISSDGYNATAKDHYLQLGFNSYYVGLFGRPDTFNVEYTDGKSVKSVKYAAFRPKSIPSLPLGPRDDSLFTKFKKAGIKYRYLDPGKTTMLMKIEKFSHKYDMRAYRKIFRKLKKNKSDNLVIDLRNNGGGSLANAYRLLSYLIDTAKTQTLRTSIRNYPMRKYTHGNIWFRFTRMAYKVIGKHESRNDTDSFIYTIKPRKKNHFDGRVFVLINGGSFSASSLVAAYLKYKNRATFIGEETGGTIEGCNAGITPYYKLPNTGIRVRMPAFRIIHDVSPGITGKGVLPDYRTEYTFRDIITRKDLELLKVKELLKIP
jgi:hypothetical protein